MEAILVRLQSPGRELPGADLVARHRFRVRFRTHRFGGGMVRESRAEGSRLKRKGDQARAIPQLLGVLTKRGLESKTICVGNGDLRRPEIVKSSATRYRSSRYVRMPRQLRRIKVTMLKVLYCGYRSETFRFGSVCAGSVRVEWRRAFRAWT